MAAASPRGASCRGWAGRAGRPARAPGAGPGRCAGRTRSPRRPPRGPSPASCAVVSSWPATTWAFVTTTPFPASQPLPCTPSPQAVPSTFTTLAPGTTHVRVAGDGRIGPSHARIGTLDLRERVEPRERADDRARRRQVGVQLGEDRGALDRLPQVARPRRLEGHRPADPRQAEAQRRHQSRAAEPVEHAEALAEPVAQAESEHLERRGHDAAHEQRPQQREHRGVGRARTLLEELGAHARAHHGARGEAREGQRPHDQALQVAPYRHQGHEGDDDPIDSGHAPS